MIQSVHPYLRCWRRDPAQIRRCLLPHRHRRRRLSRQYRHRHHLCRHRRRRHLPLRLPTVS